MKITKVTFNRDIKTHGVVRGYGGTTSGIDGRTMDLHYEPRALMLEVRDPSRPDLGVLLIPHANIESMHAVDPEAVAKAAADAQAMSERAKERAAAIIASTTAPEKPQPRKG